MMTPPPPHLKKKVNQYIRYWYIAEISILNATLLLFLLLIFISELIASHACRHSNHVGMIRVLCGLMILST